MGGLTKFLQSQFDLDEHDTDVRTEVVAGITTFLAMSYIVVVNPSILAAAGEKPGIAVAGQSPGEVRQMLAVVTILSAVVAISVMALYANRPFGLAPGLGLNAFFAFTVVGALGVPWQTALAAVFVEGLIFIGLTMAGVREYVVNLFPEPVKFAVGTGIGLFLAIIGLQAMNVIVDDPATMVSLGSIATDPVALLSIFGLFLTMALYARGIRGSIVLGIVLTTVVGWVATIIGITKPGVLAPESLPAAQYNIAPLVGAFIDGLGSVEAFSFALIVFTFFFVDFFDTAGTLVGVSQVAGFLDENGDLPEMEKPLMADAIGTTVSGMLGTSTVTTYIESATGVEAGGRTGLTAAVVGLLFLGSLLVVPLAAAVPLYASHIALVMVGVMMMRNVTEVRWDDMAHALPAAMTVIVMPLSYSIAYGIAAGIITYPVVMAAQGRNDEVHLGQWGLAVAFVVYFAVRTSGLVG